MKALGWTIVGYWLIGCLIAGIGTAQTRHVEGSDLLTIAAIWPAIPGAYVAHHVLGMHGEPKP